MNKNIKRIIALTLTISAFSTISAITPGIAFDMTTKPVYAASYSPDDGELKTLTVKSINGDTLDLRDGYNGSTVKLNEDKEYYAKLTTDSDGIKISSKVEGDGYIVKIFTSDKADATAYDPGDKILLEKGDTTLYVRTYESDSAFRKAKNTLDDVSICENGYTLNVRKTTESSYEDTTQDPIYLYNIEPSTGDITFIKGKTSYNMKVDSAVDHIRITATPEDSNDRVRINGSLVESADKYRKVVDLANGKNEIKIKVTDDKDNQRTYTLNVTRGDSSSDTQDDIYLEDLTLSEGSIDFSQDETSYNVDLDQTVSDITIGAKPEDDNYAVTIDGDEVTSGDNYEKEVSLSKGENTIDVVIQDELNNKKRTYTLTINRGTVAKTDTTTDTQTDTSTDKKTGWVETNDGWKYNNENGKLLKNSWLYDKDAGVYYYLNADGIKETGWFKDKDNWYLLNEKGAMLTGWQKTDGKWYLLDANGAMRTGWYKQEAAVEGNNNDKAQSNTSKDTTSSTNTTTTNADATNTNTTKTEGWYYLNVDGSMKTEWLLDGKKWYYLNTKGIMQKGWLISSNSKYYLNEDGTMATGTKTIDGKVCKFSNSGALII